MPNDKTERFISELMLAAKSEDPKVVVTAFRAATAILASTKQTWEDFVRGRVAKAGATSDSPDGAASDPDVVNPLLEKAMRNTDPNSSFYSFLSSLADQFKDRGFLTTKQFEALRRSANR